MECRRREEESPGAQGEGWKQRKGTCRRDPELLGRLHAHPRRVDYGLDYVTQVLFGPGSLACEAGPLPLAWPFHRRREALAIWTYRLALSAPEGVIACLSPFSLEVEEQREQQKSDAFTVLLPTPHAPVLLWRNSRMT